MIFILYYTGCYLAVNYLISFRDNRVGKLVLQSPWNGTVSPSFRLFVRTPFLLRLSKPFMNMRGIESVTTLKQILLHLGSDHDWADILNNLKLLETPTSILLLPGKSEVSNKQAAVDIRKIIGGRRTTVKAVAGASSMSFVHRIEAVIEIKKELLCFYDFFSSTGDRVSFIVEGNESMTDSAGSVGGMGVGSVFGDETHAESLQSMRSTNGSFCINNKTYI